MQDALETRAYQIETRIGHAAATDTVTAGRAQEGFEEKAHGGPMGPMSAQAEDPIGAHGEGPLKGVGKGRREFAGPSGQGVLDPEL